MEHHSSYSAPRSSRGSEHTRPAASRPSQRRSRSPKKGSSFGHILLCYILPFLAVNLAIFFIVTATPKIEMTISDTTDYKTLDVSFKVHSLLPLKKMTTTLESQPIEFQKEKGVYHAVLTNNGTLEVYVLSLNGMQAQDIEHIAVLDDTPPSFDEESVVIENGTPPKASEVCWQWIKTVFVCLVSFFGAAFAIMTFNNDVNVGDVLSQVYFQVMGRQPDGFGLMEAGYSVGLAIGILVFFNHIAVKKLNTDPTPLEVEMRLYEENICKTLIDQAGRKEKEIDVD